MSKPQILPPPPMSNIAQLPGRDWLARLRDFSLRCATASAGEAVELVRAAYMLFNAAPPNWRNLLGNLPSRSMIEALLDAGAAADAALKIIEPRAGYMLSHGPGGRHIATVVLAESADEITVEASHAAAALIGGFAGAVAAIGEARTAG